MLPVKRQRAMQTLLLQESWQRMFELSAPSTRELKTHSHWQAVHMHPSTTTNSSLNEYEGKYTHATFIHGPTRYEHDERPTSIPETQETRMPSQFEIQLDHEMDIEDRPTFTPVPEPDFR